MSFLRFIVAALTVVWIGVSRPVFAEIKPNIIFILADDLGVSDLGCTGSTFHETPNLDRLSREGMRFTEGYAACPVCSPSRASAMTGKYPPRTGITDYIGGHRSGRLLPAPNADHLKLEEKTIAEALKELGYVTAHIGKWHLGKTNFYPENQGFDVNVGGYERGHPPSYFSPFKIPTLTDGVDGEYLTDRLATECEKFIEANKDRPFFLNLWPYAVHTPLQAKADLVKKYEAKLAKMPASAPSDYRPEGERQDRRVQNHAVYAAMLESLDNNVGRIMKKLAALGIERRTMIIFTSDNGGLSTSEGSPTSNAPYRAGKGWLYEGGTRVPLLIKWPGVTKPGSQCNTPVVTVDFFPTLCAAAGLKSSAVKHLDGRNIIPLLKGGTIPARNLFWHYPHYGNQGGQPGGAVRAGDWKLIEWHDADRRELYNLRDDVIEQLDVAAAQPQKVQELQALLGAWRKDVGAVMPTLNPKWPGAAEAEKKKPAKAKK